jgi:hypothetical protein
VVASVCLYMGIQRRLQVIGLLVSQMRFVIIYVDKATLLYRQQSECIRRGVIIWEERTYDIVRFLSSYSGEYEDDLAFWDIVLLSLLSVRLHGAISHKAVIFNM